MSISQRAIAAGEMRPADQPLAERFRLASDEWVDLDAAARLLEEMKTTALEQQKAALIIARGPMADNAAERTVKAGPGWEDYIHRMVDARTKANKVKAHLDYLRILERQEDRMGWLQRSEHKMGRSST